MGDVFVEANIHFVFGLILGSAQLSSCPCPLSF